MVVPPVVLLALTHAIWILALLSLGGAIAILAAGIGAAFADHGEADDDHGSTSPRRIA